MYNKEFDDDLQNLNDLVKRYENAARDNGNSYFSESELEEIIDYYLDNDKLQHAFEAAEQGLNQFQFSTTFYQKKAEILLEWNRLDEALENLETAATYSPNETSIILLKADVYTHKGEYAIAVDLVKSALENASEEEKVDLYLELADVYEEWEKYYEVIEQLESCIALDPDNEEALNRMWFCTELTETYAQSAVFHQSLVDQHPYNATAWYNLAHAFSGLEQYDKSLEAFDFVIAIDEDYEPAYTDAGDVHYKQMNYEKAIEFYLEAVEKGGPKKEIYYQIAKAYQHIEKYIKSREYLKKCINIDPYYAKAFHKLGLNYLESKLPKNAISPLERALKLDNNNYEYLNSMAAAYFLNEEQEKTLDIYYRMLEINESDKRIYLNIVSILYEQGRVGDAIELLDAALHLFEGEADFLYVKTAFLYELGKKNEMFDTLLRALEIDPSAHQQLFELLPEMANDNAVLALIESYL
ncbi:MAG: tetratricopeptide repeat protein [Bacteroidetes bacterium]|nr:tetratricopeptide repeat protein [Bacteroidota bacterium]